LFICEPMLQLYVRTTDQDVRTVSRRRVGRSTTRLGVQVVWFDNFLTREADVSQQTDAVFRDTVINEHLFTDRGTDDHQHSLDEPVTATEHVPRVSAL